MKNLQNNLFLQLRTICLAIAKGDYSRVKELEEFTVEGRYSKIVTDLAESFSFMLLKLEAREHKLEKMVEELKKAKARLKNQNSSLKERITTLKIDIDTIKKSMEVRKITETAFFKELKRKSKKLREK